MIITLDGPTASGKSMLGRMLAKELGYYYLYSGLMFRALAYLLKNQYGYSTEQFENPRIEDIQEILDPTRFVYTYDDQRKERITFDGTDITPHLKEGEIDQFASLVSRSGTVREKLMHLQRSIAKSADLIVDGRDSGSVVFPDADHKFYLTALEDERAERWRKQQRAYGADISLEEARAYITARDQRDMNRKNAPLVIPEGAHVIDNSDQTPRESLDAMLVLMGR